MAEKYTLIGKDFTPPDVVAKVTGQAKFAEDFRAEGMLFAKLFLSPMPHAQVRRLDARQALAMEGVAGILTPDDIPETSFPSEPALTKEPLFAGQPIAAIAAVDETTAADAVERLRVDLQPRPFVLNALDSLRPGGPDANRFGNTVPERGFDGPAQRVKWSARDFVRAGEGNLPTGEAIVDWSYGDVEAGFEQADLILDETVVSQSNAHHSMEPRTSLAYWQNGKLYLHASTQSMSFVIPTVARMMQLDPSQVVLIGQYCGGGFGSKGSGYPQWVIPAFLAKKTGRPVMLRISRREEFLLGRSRAGFQARVKIGFRADGRITALDLFVVQDNGSYSGFNDLDSGLDAASLVFQPMAMRARGLRVHTNSPPKSAQRGPGQNQMALIMEPIIHKAAKQLGVDQVEIRKINAPSHDAKYGARQGGVTSSYLPEAIEKGAKLFNWEEQKKESGRRNGTKVVGVGVGSAYHSAGSSGFDGLLVIKPDGKVYVHTGVGNLGTFSYAATARAAAEALQVPWEQVEIVRGDSSKGLPWNLGQFGSNTSHTMTRTNWAAGQDAKRKLQEIAAGDLGGSPDDYEVSGGRVYSKSDRSQGLTFAEAASRAIELGGKYSGHDLPDDINPITTAAAKLLAGQGLVGVAKDTLPRTGTVPAFAVGFAKVEVDTETGEVKILDYTAVADCGTVIHPMSLRSQVKSGAVQGFGLALFETYFYDRQYGVPLDPGLHGRKIPTYLDVPVDMQADAVDMPDPQNPVGAKGVGEPPMGAGATAVACAVADALGVYFNRSPITPSMILDAVHGNESPIGPLEVHVS